MCNEFAREQNLEELAALFAGVDELPLFGWEGGRLPNDTAGRTSIRISDVPPGLERLGPTPRAQISSEVERPRPGPKGSSGLDC